MPRLAAAGAIAGAVLIGAPGASAAVTIGSDFTGLTANSSNFGDTGSPATVPAGLVASPIDGVVVRWRAGWSNGDGDARLRVITPLSGPFLFKTASAIETDFSGAFGEFATRIPIRAGDRIAVDDTDPTAHGNPVVRTGVPGTSYDWWTTVPGDGASLPPTSNSAAELFLNADVEADADGDGFGDETQDNCPGVSGATSGCAPAVAPTTTATKKKCKKHKAKRRGAAEAKKKCKKRK
jgi:hypothetical protein